MKIKTIAFLFNVRHSYPDPKDYRNQLETDFDDPVTIKNQIKHLRKCGYKVIPIEADEKAYLKLTRLKSKIDLVFNIAEGKHGLDREAQIPAILEMLEMPYTGCGPLAEGLILNKAKTKEVLSFYNVPTIPHQQFEKTDEVLKSNLGFPLIVKPIGQGSSAGITNQSVVFDPDSLYKQVAKVIKNFSQPALVEPFLTGREFSVSLLGNPPVVLPIIESDHSILPKNYLPFDSLEVKWFFEENAQGGNYLTCPAKLNKSLEQKITQICLQAWKALGVRDWCRVDIRCDKDERPYVLEVNSPPGILPPKVSMTSYFPLAARKAGLDYEEMLQNIILSASTRYGFGGR